MECNVCHERAAVDSCVVCRTMLCEDCGTPCHHCGRPACPEHRYVSSHGNTYCITCAEKRKSYHGHKRPDAKHKEAAEDTAFRPEEEEAERPVLTASARKPPPAWKLSLYTAVLGIVVAVVLLLIPGFRRVPISGAIQLPTIYPLLLLPLIAAFWGVVGLLKKEEEAPDQKEDELAEFLDDDSARDRRRCLYGILAAVVALAMLLVAESMARQEEQAVLQEEEQQYDLTPEERRGALDRFRR